MTAFRADRLQRRARVPGITDDLPAADLCGHDERLGSAHRTFNKSRRRADGGELRGDREGALDRGARSAPWRTSLAAPNRKSYIKTRPQLPGFASAGVKAGVQLGLLITVALALVTLVIVSRVRLPLPGHDAPVNIAGVWCSVPSPLRRLLVSDIFVRTCEGMVDVFLVIYATNIVGVTAPQYGVLVAAEMLTATVIYIPAATIADSIGRKPFVIATFLCFSMFPVAVALASGFTSLVIAFIIGGLREIGEPARKALIVDLAESHVRARTIGLYYLMRSLAITPAATIGGLLWNLSPQTPFVAAGIIGAIGTIVFAATVEERYAV